MNRRALAVLALALVLAGCATKTPTPVAPTDADWAAIWADDYTCKAKEFATVDIATVVAAPQVFYDKCIRLRALLKDRTLYRNAATLGHEAGIALYQKGDKTTSGPHAQFVTVSGRLRSCADRNVRVHALLKRLPQPDPVPSGGAVNIIHLYCEGISSPALFATDVMSMPTAMD